MNKALNCPCSCWWNIPGGGDFSNPIDGGCGIEDKVNNLADTFDANPALPLCPFYVDASLPLITGAIQEIRTRNGLL